MKPFFCLLIAFVFCSISGSWASPYGIEDFAKGQLSIQSADKTHNFDIEIAQTDDQRQRGLMFRRSLAENHGMLFIYDSARHVSMWMKNTYVPLDMLFIDQNKKIVRIAKSTTPLSLDHISSGQPIVYVLEVLAGMTDQLMIKPGDTVSWQAEK